MHIRCWALPYPATSLLPPTYLVVIGVLLVPQLEDILLELHRIPELQDGRQECVSALQRFHPRWPAPGASILLAGTNPSPVAAARERIRMRGTGLHGSASCMCSLTVWDKTSWHRFLMRVQVQSAGQAL